jgi:hypothetical protein
MKTNLIKNLESKFDLSDDKLKQLEILLLNNIQDDKRENFVNKLQNIFNEKPDYISITKSFGK